MFFPLPKQAKKCSIQRVLCTRPVTQFPARCQCFVALSVLICLATSPLHADQAIKIVVPNEFAETEGDQLNGTLIRFPIKGQWVFPAEEFASLPASYRWIAGIASRPDESALLPRSTTYGDIQYRLSTTTIEPGDLSNYFDENVGPDEMVVFDHSPYTIAADDIPDPDAPGPRDFDYRFKFDAPFFYDPTTGRNLILEFRTKSGYLDVAPFLDAQGSYIVGIGALDAEATEATIHSSGSVVYQFSFVPVGDYSGDGILDVIDLDTLATAIQEGNVDQQFDLDQNGTVDLEDHAYWVRDIKQTWMGDANLDGEFNSLDLVKVFQSGKFETEQIAGWSEGDWNGDERFGSGDFVAAFQDGGYEVGPRTLAAAVVPEPSSAILLTLAFLSIVCIRKR
jgi:hypothetical protein